MIKEAYCSFEVAKLLKEKGFVTPCDWLYCNDGTFGHRNSLWDKEMFPAPTHQMAMKWLREVHNILIVVSITYEKERYDWYICGIKGDPWKKELFHEERNITYDTYEEAVEAALKYALKILI